MVKIIAYGFVMHTHSYLRDAWCILDFVVVSLAWCAVARTRPVPVRALLLTLVAHHLVACRVPLLVPSFGNFTVLRTLRALRPLRTLRFVPGMPVLISSIFKAIPPLSSVAGLCAFIFLIFGIVGEELFEGSLHVYCDDPNHPVGSDDDHRQLMQRMLKGGGAGGRAVVTFCNLGDSSVCDEGQECLYHGKNPEGRSVHFDSVIDASMAIVQVITFDTWSNVM